jgi:hypothetical protein
MDPNYKKVFSKIATTQIYQNNLVEYHAKRR